MRAQSSTERVVLDVAYTRLSRDANGKPHKTQTAAINRDLAAIGIDPASVRRFRDTNMSAAPDTEERPGWESVQRVIRDADPATTIVRVWVFAADRVTRDVDQTNVIANLFEAAGAELWVAGLGRVPLAPERRGQWMALLAQAQTEVAVSKHRTASALGLLAAEGRQHGIVPYGWTRRYAMDEETGRRVATTIVDPEQAAIVNHMADRVLAGESLRAICRDLNARKVPPPGAGRVRKRDDDRKIVTRAGTEWVPTKVRQLLVRESNIAVRSLRRAMPRRIDGVLVQPQPVPGDWPPIMDAGTYARVVGVLRAPERQTSLNNRASHLLSNIATCGVCGERLTAQVSRGTHQGVPRTMATTTYRCVRSHVSKAERRVDGVVLAYLFAALGALKIERATLSDQSAEISTAQQRRAALEAERADLLAMLKDRIITAAEARPSLDRNTRALAEQDAAIEAARRVMFGDDLLRPLLDADDMEAFWDVMEIGPRRAVVGSLLRVVLMPSTRRGKSAFDPNLVVITPRI